MTTLGGINESDWDQVADLAAEIANLTLADEDADDSALRGRLLQLLGEFRLKYGDRPDLLATAADYETDPTIQVALLATAFLIALKSDDQVNQAMIAESMAELLENEAPKSGLASHWRERTVS